MASRCQKGYGMKKCPVLKGCDCPDGCPPCFGRPEFGCLNEVGHDGLCKYCREAQTNDKCDKSIQGD